MTAHLGQFLFPIGFVSHFLETIGLRSPMHTAAIAHRHATCAYASTCRRRRITAVHPPGTHTSPPRRRFYHAARTGTRSVRGVFFLAVGDRAAFPPTRRRQPHLHRGNGGGGLPDKSLEFFFFDTAWQWLVAVVRRPVSPVPSPFTTPPPSVLSDAHGGLPILSSFLFRRSTLRSPIKHVFRHSGVSSSPSLLPRARFPLHPFPHPSSLLSPPPPFFARLPSPGSRLRACHVFLCCCSRRRAVLRATSYVNRVTPSGTLALATPSSLK